MSNEEKKAIEIVEKFKPLVTTWDCYNDCPENPDNILKHAKQCALIAVEEKEKTALRFIGDDRTKWSIGQFEIYDELQTIKQHIEKL